MLLENASTELCELIGVNNVVPLKIIIKNLILGKYIDQHTSNYD